MSYLRSDWCGALLESIGNKEPSQDVLQWLMSWTKFETGTPPGASYNLLNTTEPNTPGVVSNFNSVGVKNYDTFAHGIQANSKVLQNGYYNRLLDSLKNNDIDALKTSPYINGELSIWGTGNKQADINNMLGQVKDDKFPGTMNMPVPSNDDIAKLEFLCLIHGSWWDSGIQTSWLEAYNSGTYYGPALCNEYTVGNVTFQHFSGASCLWDKVNNKANWRKNV